MPPARPVERHTVGLGLRHLARPSEPDPADLGYQYGRPAVTDPIYPARLPADNPEALTMPRLAPYGPTVRATEKARHGLGVIQECLLLDRRAARPQPAELVPRLSEL